MPQLELGFPQFNVYQHAAHVTVAALDVVLPGNVDPRRLFDLVRWLLMVLFPLTVFWSLRHMGIADIGAAVAGGFAALLSGAFRYGFEYDSYVWRGLGLYTQLFGMHLVFVSLALLYDVLTRGKRIFAAALACAALALTHLIYAYMLALTVVPLFLGTLARGRVRANVLRLGAVGALALALSSYMWLPFLSNSAYLNVSPYLGRDKYDSFGLPAILGWLASGDLLDHGRLPVVTALVAAGIVAAVWTRTRVALLTLGLFVVWLLLYAGRPTLGRIADLLPLSQGLLFHRFVGGVDVFAIVLMGVGAAFLWRVLRVETRPGGMAAAALVLVALSLPVLTERWSFYADNTTWMLQTRSAIARDADTATVLGALRALPPGRVYAGMRSNWGQSVNFGIPFNSVRLYNMAVYEERDAVAPPYRDASLNSDLLWDFNDQNIEQYVLYNVDYVIAPPSIRLPAQLVPLTTTPTLTLYRAPGGGYVEYAGVSARQRYANEDQLFPKMRAWVNSDAPGQRDFLRFDYPASGAAPDDGWSPTSRCPNDGTLVSEDVRPSRFDVVVECAAASTLVFKVTYHPDWIVSVDGRPAAPYMVSPSYLAVDLPAGRHAVVAEYRSGPLKTPLLALGGLVLLAMAGTSVWTRRDALPSLRSRVSAAPADARAWLRAHPRVTAAAIGAALTLPAIAVTIVTTPPIAFANGLGVDGSVYAAMVRALREHINTLPAPPWVYRVLPAWLVAVGQLDIPLGFGLLNLISALATGALLLRFLENAGASRRMAALGVVWWSVLPMTIRWMYLYPALPDMFGFALLMTLLVLVQERRWVLFAVALVAGALTRENLLVMLVPFVFLARREEGWRRAAIETAIISAPAALALLLVRVFPPIAPYEIYPNWIATFRIDVNVGRIIHNTDGHLWRFLLVGPITLGLFAAIPFARWARTRAVLTRHPEWSWYLVSSLVLSIIGGWDDDRFFVWLVPALALLCFRGERRWAPWRMLALTVLQLVIVRFAWPVGTTENDYFQFLVAYMDQGRMWLLAVLTAVLMAAAIAVLRVTREADA